MAAYPELVGPLREEIETVVHQHGWSKPSVDKMHKLDGLFRESLYSTGITPGTYFPHIHVSSRGESVDDGSAFQLVSFAKPDARSPSLMEPP